MGSNTLTVRVLNFFFCCYFCPLWFLSLGSFVLWCFCPFWLFSIHPRDRMTRMLIVHTCIMLSYEQKLDCTNWLFEYMYLNIFSFGGFVRFNFYHFWLLSYGVFVHFVFFFCPPMWSHDENVDCLHLYHMITWTEMGSYTLIVGVLKYFLFWGFCPLWFLSFGAVVLWCFCPFFLFSVWTSDCMTRIFIVHTCIMWWHEQKWDQTHSLLEY